MTKYSVYPGHLQAWRPTFYVGAHVSRPIHLLPRKNQADNDVITSTMLANGIIKRMIENAK